MPAYSTPASGFCLLWPAQHLGDDYAAAMYAVGCRRDKMPARAKGYAVTVMPGTPGHSLRSSQGRSQRLQSTSLPSARLEALERGRGRAATLCRAVARGSTTVWERVEHLRELSEEQADRIEEAMKVRFDGELVEKKLNPRVDVDLKLLANKLANTITHDVKQAIKPIMRQSLQEWAALDNIDFKKMTPRELDSLWKQGRGLLMAAQDKGMGLVAPSMLHKIKLQLVDITQQSKEILKQTYLPRTAIAFTQVDDAAVTQITTQTGWWIRDSSGAISTSLSKQGEQIIAGGIKEGVGRNVIAERLRTALPNMWAQYGFNYARTVVAASVSRARSYSEVSSYQQAGISFLEVVAMLDERTTDICRSMDGKIIEVRIAADHINTAASVAAPQDIINVAPFMREVVNPKTKDLEIWLGGKSPVRYATVNRSGKGKVDDRGDITKYLSTKELNKRGVTTPPYHYNCRTMTVPRVEMVQVPQNFEPQSSPVPSSDDLKKVPKAPKMQKPVNIIPEPKPTKPVNSGQPKPIDAPTPVAPTPEPDPFKTLVEQVPDYYPSNIQGYNAKVKAAVEELNPGQAIELLEVKLDAKLSTLLYKYKTESGYIGDYLTSFHHLQKRKLQQQIWGRVGFPKKPQLPKPPPVPKTGTHPIKSMQRSKAGTTEFKKANERIKQWNELDSVAQMRKTAKEMVNDPDWVAYAKRKGIRLDNELDTLEFVKSHKANWARTSRDRSEEMHYLQIAVWREYGLGDKSLKMLKQEIVDRLTQRKEFIQTVKAYRAYVRAQYKTTQEFLKQQNVKSMPVARGFGVRQRSAAPSNSKFEGVAEVGKQITQPLSSFSTDARKAKQFADGKGLSVVVKQEVPAERIFGTYHTGMGTDYETEIVIIGGEDDITDHVSWMSGKVTMDWAKMKKLLF